MKVKLEIEKNKDVFSCKHFIKWVKTHNWGSLENDKDLILRHLRTYFGDDI